MTSVSMAMPTPIATQNRLLNPSSNSPSFLNPFPLNLTKKASFVNSASKSGLRVTASLKQNAITGFTAAALTASMVIPDVAEAATSGVSPSLQNFLLSIGAGGVVLFAILGAVVGVSNFDPVKRA